MGRIANHGVNLFTCELPFNWYLLSHPLLRLLYLPRRHPNLFSIVLNLRTFIFCVLLYFCVFYIKCKERKKHKIFSFTICFPARHFSCICPDVFLTSVCSSVILSSSSIDYGNGWLIYSRWDKLNNSNSNNNNNNNNDNIKFP